MKSVQMALDDDCEYCCRAQSLLGMDVVRCAFCDHELNSTEKCGASVEIFGFLAAHGQLLTLCGLSLSSVSLLVFPLENSLYRLRSGTIFSSSGSASQKEDMQGGIREGFLDYICNSTSDEHNLVLRLSVDFDAIRVPPTSLFKLDEDCIYSLEP